MGHHSLVIVPHDELESLRTPDFGESLYRAILSFRARDANNIALPQHSCSARVVASFKDDTPPTIVIADGWRCIDINRQDIPDDLKRYLKYTAKNIP